MPSCPDSNPLRRDGLSQAQRQLPAQAPSFARLDERTGDDLLAFAAAYAQAAGVRFYGASGPDAAPDYTTWAALMQAPGGQSLAALEARADNPPHLALFLAFLKLFGLAQDQLNAFTQRHLDFYYRDVLQLRERPAEPDQVHLTFELARNVADYLLPAGTPFDAGPDAGKQPQLYQTATERLVNRAGLAHLRSVYVQPDAENIQLTLLAASADGMGAPLPAADPTWGAFGPAAASWPTGTIGFALAAPVLRMAEGTRQVTVTIGLPDYYTPPFNSLPVAVQLSGAQAWIQAPADGHNQSILLLDTDPDSEDNIYTLTVELPASDPRAVVGYNAAALDGGYATTAPVLRVLLSGPNDYLLLRDLPIRSVRVDVQVDGIRKTLALANDQGRLDPQKSFQPFGPSPAVGSKLYVSCAETVGKSLTEVRAYVPEWVGKIGNQALDDYYQAAGYGSDFYADERTVTIQVHGHAVQASADDADDEGDPRIIGLFKPTNFSDVAIERDSQNRLKFTPKLKMALTPSFELHTQVNGGETYYDLTIAPPTYAAKLEEVVPRQFEQPAPGPELLLTVSLNEDFGHPAYQQMYSQWLATQAQAPNDIPPPLPPYTPVAQALVLGYSATSETVLVDESAANAGDFAQRNLYLLHHGVFGWAEEHPWLKRPLAFLEAAHDPTDFTRRNTAYLLPQLAPEGTFVLGLRDAQALDTVAVLFQVAEGSANAARPPAYVEWSVLCQNQWYPLTEAHAPLDATDNLLTSGIIEFVLPAETTTTNTLLEPGSVWLRGELKTGLGEDAQPALPDSVCRLVGVHPQAVLARFADHDNAARHYAAPLPAGSISKARLGTPGLKTVQQPYAGFGGRPPEDDAAFYTRVRERLRHKQRAVTIWDYEHLILEQFPSLYRVQCLNHTRVQEDPSTHQPQLLGMAPGCVTLVVVPDLRHAYASSALTPGVAGRTLQAVQDFARALAGPQVQVQAVNPVYDQVQIEGNVTFRRGYAPALYLPQLKQALRDFLSPWTQSSGDALAFGGTLHKSSVVAFLERQPCVDFITNLKMAFLANSADQDTLTASHPWSVLTSAPTHLLT